jgi:hypothetical protein
MSVNIMSNIPFLGKIYVPLLRFVIKAFIFEF